MKLRLNNVTTEFMALTVTIVTVLKQFTIFENHFKVSFVSYRKKSSIYHQRKDL